ncbi:MAG TPA: hypothetical protein VGO78_12660 [Acidimicrobiales bacterium]|nr:hypothetical protein [Acidimicrobiales bacterium]
MNRRRALAMGAAGLGTLLAGCGSGRDGDGTARSGPDTGNPADPAGHAAPESTAGAQAVAPPTAPPAPTTTLVTAGDLAGRFDAGGVNGCTLTPQTIAGPSYLEVDALRSDLRDDRQGVPLGLGLRVLDPDCVPLAGAAVELWNCDALGLYSGYPQREGDTTGLTFCRGTQVTDANGIVAFTTVYPGWYRTRAPHLHAKVLLSSTALLTTQLFLDDAVSATVFTSAPYATHTGQDTFNDTDGMFVPATVLTLSPDATGGYLGLLDLTVRPA